MIAKTPDYIGGEPKRENLYKVVIAAYVLSQLGLQGPQARYKAATYLEQSEE